MHPRVVLLFVAAAMSLIGWQTARYHPNYLALSALWAGLAFAAALACVLAVAHPHRAWVALSGSTLVCSAAGRSVAIVGQLVVDGVDASQRPSFMIAAVTWSVIALLVYVVWTEYILPWSIGGRR